MVVSIWILTMVLLLPTTAALAHPGSETREAMAAARDAAFADADADGDGALSIEEFAVFRELLEQASMEKHFEALDGDGDGLVSAEELEEGEGRRRGRRLRRF